MFATRCSSSCLSGLNRGVFDDEIVVCVGLKWLVARVHHALPNEILAFLEEGLKPVHYYYLGGDMCLLYQSINLYVVS